MPKIDYLVENLTQFELLRMGSGYISPFNISRKIGKIFNSVADPGCLSRSPDPNSFHPGSEFFQSRIRIKEFKYFNSKKWFLSSRNMIWVAHPGS